jgi:hypothetical protein
MDQAGKESLPVHNSQRRKIPENYLKSSSDTTTPRYNPPGLMY